MFDVQHHRLISCQKKHIIGKAPGQPLRKSWRLKTVRFDDGPQEIWVRFGAIGRRAHPASVSWGK